MNAAEFNALYEVGIPVFAYPGARPEDFPNARRIVTKTRSRASVLGGHTDVVWVEDHSACIALSHVDVITEDEYKAAKQAAAVAALGALPVPAGSRPEPMTPRQLAEVRKSWAAYQKSHDRTGLHACCSAHAAANHVPALLAEVERMTAELAKYATSGGAS